MGKENNDMLQIEAGDLPPALVADSRSLRVGQFVLAVGHPWGQRGAVAAGLISGLGSAPTRGPRGSIPVIRTDVGLAPGNSGGPMVNASGGVVGLNTMFVVRIFLHARKRGRWCEWRFRSAWRSRSAGR